MTNNSVNNRIFYLDICRCFATIAVIGFHVGSYGIARNILIVLTNWCVPIFITITGALFLDFSKESPTYTLILHRIIRLLRTLIFWGLFYNFVSLTIIERKLSFSTLIVSAKMVLSADTTFCYQFWYIYMIIGLYLLIPVLDKFIRYSQIRDVLTLLIITTFFSIILRTVSLVCSGTYDDTFWKSAFTCFSGFSSYLLLGYWLRTRSLTPKSLFVLCFTCILQILIVIVTIALNFNTFEYYTGYQSILTYELTMLVIVASQQMVPFVQKHPRLQKAIQYISKESFGIFVFHVIILQMLRKLFGIDCTFAPQPISIPLLITIVLFLSLLCTRIFKKFKFSTFIL